MTQNEAFVSPSQVITLRKLWIAYRDDEFHDTKNEKLVLFLTQFLSVYADANFSNLKRVFGDSREISKTLAWNLLENLEEITQFKDSEFPIEERFYDYLSNIRSNGGLYLLWTTHIFSSLESNIAHIHKLAASIVIIVQTILNMRNKMRVIEAGSSNEERPQWMNHFFAFKFGKLRSFVHVPWLPSSLLFLIEDAEANFREEETLVVHGKEKFIGVCYHFLGIIQNLARYPETLDNLVRYNQVQNLLQLLQPRTSAESEEFVPLYRQVIRTLSKLIEASTTHLKKILQIRQLGIVTFLLHILERKCHKPIICMEICQLVVYTIRRSSHLTLVIFEDFKESGGYKIFADNLTWIGIHGTAYHRYEMLATLSHMMFIRQTEKDPIDDVDEIKNKEAYSIFIRGFQESRSSDFQYDILRTMLPLLLLNRSGYDIISSYVPPFDHLFLLFDGLHTRNKKFILNMMEKVLEDATLSDQELTSYCLLLQRKRPHTMIMIMQQLTMLLKTKKISREQLENAGLIHSFLDLAVVPVKLETAHAIVGKEELEKCLALIESIEANQQKLSRMCSADFETFVVPAELETVVGASGSVEDFLCVLYSISSLALELMLVFLSTSHRNQVCFVETGVLTKLYALLYDDSLRHAALRIIAVIAVGDQKAIHVSVVQQLIGILQNCSGSSNIESRVIRMRMDVLSTLACMFHSNEKTKHAFRDQFGITWAIAVIDSIGHRVKDEGTSLVTPEVLGYLKALLNIFTTLLHNNARNQAYFRETIQFDSLRESLQQWKFIEGTEALSLCDNLLDMALAGSWPPSCPEHPLEYQNEIFQYSYGTASTPRVGTLERAKELVCSYTCTRCESCLLVNLPEVIKVILELVGNGLPNMREDVIRLIIQRLKFILKIIPENQKRLCSVNITEVIFDYYYSVLQSDSKLHRLLQKLLEVLCTFHISVAELWKYFQLFSPDGFPTPILRTLNQICANQKRAPSHYIQFPFNSSSVDITLSNRTWPPSNGYAFSMWFQTQTAYSCKIFSLSLENSNSTTISLWCEDNQLVLKLQHPKEGQTDIYFDRNENTILQPDVWYHVTLSHAPSVLIEGKRETSRNTKLYIDGIRVGVATAPFPKSSGSGRVCGSLGSRTASPPPSGSKYSRIEPQMWNLGATYLFDEPPTDTECFLLYQLGPDYIGNLDIDLKSFYNPYSVVTPAFVRTIPSNHFTLLTNDWKMQLNALQEKIIFAFSPRNIVFAQSVRGPLSSSSGSSPLSTTGLVPNFASSDTAISISRTFVRDTMSNIGGISTVIFLIAMIGDPEQRRISLEILYKILEFSAQNCREMEEICGYELIARLMRKNAWKIDEKMLGILFKFAGFERNPKSMGFSVGVLSNLAAFNKMIMDWRIWVRSEYSVQKQLFETLGEIVNPENEFAAFNIPRLREANVTERLLWLIHNEENTVNTAHASSLVIILRRLMETPPSAKDFNTLLRYLIRTHESKKENQAEIRELNLIRSPGANVNEKKTIREHILAMVLEIIIKNDSKVLANFRKEFKQESILFLLNHPSISTRVLVLHLLNVYLGSKEYSDRFNRTYGFLTVAEILSHYPVSDIVFSALFSILLGSAPQITKAKKNQKDRMTRRERSYSSSVLRQSIQATFDSSVTLKHPEALQTILMSTTSITCPSEIAYFAIKILHDIFLQNDRVKALLIDHHLVRLLCEVFIGEFHRRNQYAFETPEEATFANFQVESHTLSFLKALTVHSCTHGRIRIVESIIHYMDMMFALPTDYIRALQYRVIGDVLVFFHENKCSSKPKLMPIFEKLCLLAVNAHRFKPVDTLPHVKSVLDGYKDIPPGFDVLFRIPSFLPSDKSWHELYNTCFHTDLEYYRIVFDVLSKPIRSHPFDVLQNCVELYSSVSYFLLNIISANLPTKFYDPNDTSGSNDLRKSMEQPVEFLEKKPIPAGNLYLNEFDTPSSIDGKRVSTTPGQIVLSDSDIDITPEVLDLTDSFEYPGGMGTYYTPSRIEEPEEEFDEDSPMGLWIHHEKIKTETMLYILDLLCNRRLLDIYCNDVNFIISLLMQTMDLFHSASGPVRVITFRLWAKITAKCRANAVVKMIFNEQIHSYLQTRNPNDLLEKGIRIDHMVNTVVLTRECYLANEKYVRENEEYRKPHFERMANLIIPTLRNNTIRQETVQALPEAMSNVLREEEKRTQEIAQQNNDRDRTVQHHWKKLVKRMTHERAIWKIPIRTWKLDATEGPHRMRKRLKPSTDNPLLYYLTPYQFTKGKSWRTMIEENNDRSLISPHQMRERRKQQLEQIEQQESDVELRNEHLYFDLSTNTDEQWFTKCKVSLVSPFHKRDGEFLVCKKHVYFIDSNVYEHDNSTTNFEALLSHTRHRHKIKWPYHDIRELHKRRYQLKNNAMEIFLITGKTSLLSFPSNKDRDAVFDKILSFDLPNHVDYEREVAGTFIRMSITEKWQKGYISNLEYLMHLNTLAGRSFNDLTQYPVFPFVLTDFESNELELDDETRYRDLSKPMGALNEERFKRSYQMKFDMRKELGEAPFMYGTHYSNLGSVLHFLIRLAPFSYYFIEFQGGSFDVPDRSFHSILQTWRLASELSSADVKELIPSFFVLPEFLTNINSYDMGVMQKGTEISGVELPPWANNDPRLFIKLHRKALESRYVSEHLHQWIDLIFGFKQTGEAAVQARNVFHPYTYEGVNIDEIEDELERNAAITMIDNYGQTPKQVFKKSHPKRTHPTIPQCVFNSYERLVPSSIGNYPFEIGYILHRSNDNQIILRTKRIPLHPEATKYVSWGHWDQNLRVCTMDFGKLVGIIESTHNDNVNCASMPRNGRLLATGGTAGVVKVWKKLNDRSIQMKLYSVLHGHSDSITCIYVSQEWSIIVSGSMDKTCIIWDLNRCCFIYSLNQHSGKILAVAVSPTTGDIVTVSDLNDARCQLSLWSINGKLLYQRECERKINCIKFTTGMEGVCENVIFGGGDDGFLYFWSSWDLSFLVKLKGHQSPISAITINAENTQITTGDVDGYVLSWKTKKSSNN